MESATTERARLSFDDVGVPVVADVRHRGPYRMTVARSLPFLRLSAGVRDQDGRIAHIEAVRVAVEDETPSLVLELVYEEDDRAAVAEPVAPEPFPAATRRREDDTIPGFVPDMEGTEPPRRDPTLPYMPLEPDVRCEVAITTPPPAPQGFWTRLLARFAALVATLRPARG